MNLISFLLKKITGINNVNDMVKVSKATTENGYENERKMQNSPPSYLNGIYLIHGKFRSG